MSGNERVVPLEDWNGFSRSGWGKIPRKATTLKRRMVIERSREDNKSPSDFRRLELIVSQFLDKESQRQDGATVLIT